MNLDRLRWLEVVTLRERPLVPVMMYHSIGPTRDGTPLADLYLDVHEFESQLLAFKALGFQAAQVDSVRRGTLPEKPIILTFDDAYENFLIHALPLLLKHGFTATVFAVANQVGGTNLWDAKFGIAEKLMDQSQLLECVQQGVEIGAHTSNHVDLCACSPAMAKSEIETSKSVLEELLGGEIFSFSYPYGKWNDAVREVTKSAGFRAACTTGPGMNVPSTDPLALKRVNCKRGSGFPVSIARMVAARSGKAAK